MNSQILVIWTYELSDNTGFLLQRSTDSASTWPNNYTTDAATLQYIDNYVEVFGTYWYHVAATNQYGTGGFSNIADVYISASGPVTISLTVGATPDIKPYDGTTSSFQSPTITGSIVGGDTPYFTQYFTDKLVGSNIDIEPVGTVTVISDSTYNITFVPNLGIITGPPSSINDFIFFPTGSTDLPDNYPDWWSQANDMASGSNGFLTINYLPSDNVIAVFTSSNGTNWVGIGTSSFASRIIGYANGRYIGLNDLNGSNGNAQYSDDGGITWTPTTIPAPVYMYDVIHDGTQFVAVGDGGTVITSLNGADWYSAIPISDPTYSLNNIIYNGGRYVVVGPNNRGTPFSSSGTIYTSTDLITWTPVSSSISTTSGYFAVAYSSTLSGGMYLAVGENGLIASSADGVNWADYSQPDIVKFSNLTGVSWNSADSYFSVCDTKGYIFVSNDSINWTLANIDPAMAFNRETHMDYYSSINKSIVFESAPI